MEQRLWRQTEENLKTSLAAGNSFSLQTLSSLRSLIINPSTSDNTLTSILKTLAESLSLLDHRHHHHHHIFSLLADLSLRWPESTPSLSATALSLSTSLLSDPDSSPRLAAAALSLLLKTSTATAIHDSAIDDSLLVSLSFRPCVSVRVWFLKNALRLGIRPNLLLTVLLGFTKDPYPCVRQAALDGLVGVCESGVEVDDSGIVEGCYFRSVELLSDGDNCVRAAAVRAVSEWGRMLAASKQEGDKRGWCDAVFLQICAMVRDMNVGVRVEAFTALGKIVFVSENILLQSLSKKILGTIKGKQSSTPCRARPYEIHASNAAGAFIHGLEDEYSKVQRAACISLCMLTVLSDRFAAEAVDLLTYVLNDDSMIVRLEALQALHHMVTSGCLKMQEEHIDMLLGTLVDNNPQIRFKALNILGLVKLPNLQVSKLTVQSLLGSLDIYPQSEAEIFHTLFSMGQNHGNYAVSVIEDFYHKINSFSDGKLGSNSSQVAGLLVLAVSASLKHEKYFRHISPEIFAYAAAFFGRISPAFGDVVDKDSLLAYLTHCGDQGYEVESEFRSGSKALPAAKSQQEVPALVLNNVKVILATVRNLWQLIKSGCTSEALNALRYCKESLETTRTDSLEYTGVVALAFQYIRIVKLLTKIWEHFVVFRKLHPMGDVSFLLIKLDKALRDLRYRFVGLSGEDELYILELVLLSYALTLSSYHISCTTLQKLSSTITSMDVLTNAKSITCSEFVNQLKELSSTGSFSHNEVSCSTLQLTKLCNKFVPRDFSLTQIIRHVGAKLVVPSYNSVSPLRFIPGLPVGIPLDITLYNVTSEHRVWIKTTVNEELTEFVFLDLEQYGGTAEVRKFEFTSPFYKTPKVNDFTLRIIIGMECTSEDLYLVKGYGGPKHSLIYLCPEKEVYFIKMHSSTWL